MHQFKKILWWLIGAAVVLTILATAAWFVFNAWLDSAGGREAIAAEVSRRAGVPVELGEPFDFVLYPSIGAMGQGIRVGESATQPLLQADRYHIAVALKPLWEGKIVIEEVRLESGSLDLSQWSPPERENAQGAKAESAQLPQVALLDIQGLRLLPWGAGATAFNLERLTLTDFYPGESSRVALAVDGWGRLEADILLDLPAKLLRIDDLRLSLLEQMIGGRACISFSARPALMADLASEAIRLDEIQDQLMQLSLPSSGTDTGDTLPESLPFDIQLNLHADVLEYQGNRAINANIGIGPEAPALISDCGMTWRSNPLQ